MLIWDNDSKPLKSGEMTLEHPHTQYFTCVNYTQGNQSVRHVMVIAHDGLPQKKGRVLNPCPFIQQPVDGYPELML